MRANLATVFGKEGKSSEKVTIAVWEKLKQKKSYRKYFSHKAWVIYSIIFETGHDLFEKALCNFVPANKSWCGAR